MGRELKAGVEPGAGATGPTPLAEQVYQNLLTRILSPDLSPGDRITIDAMARTLGVSQTPIREALHRLDNDGLVVRTHLSGYRVAEPMSRDEFEELIDMRLLLEPAIARRAAERAEPEALEELRHLNAEMVSPAAEGQGSGYAAFARLDAELHDCIAQAAGNRVMRAALTRLHTHVQLFRLNYTIHITSMAIQEHDAILDAIGARDPDGAAYAMRAHILASAERFRAGYPESEGG